MGQDWDAWGPPDELLQLKDAAALLGVSIRTFERYLRVEGLLRTYRLPSGHRRWRRGDLEDIRQLMRRNAADAG